MKVLHSIQVDPIVRRALEEDWSFGDWTTDLCVSKEKISRATIVAKEEIIVAGIDVVARTFALVDDAVTLTWHVRDGESVSAMTKLLTLEGPSHSLLKGERVALNFFGRMCGIATLTRAFAQKLEGLPVKLLDTRKTTPGLRILEKAATVIGGARNHRLSLCDGVIIKENHIRAAGGIAQAVSRVREGLPPTLKIEVEVTNLNEVQEALAAGADLIMLDNMSVPEMTMAVRTIRGKALVEASGNVKLDNVRAIAETGVNFISTSSILHSARWSDLSLLFEL